MPPNLFLSLSVGLSTVSQAQKIFVREVQKITLSNGWRGRNISERQVPKPLEIVLRWKEVLNKETGTRWGGWLFKNSVLRFHVERPYSWHQGED